MKGFSGFPAGKLRLTPVPNQFFNELLPSIDHLGELKLTLYTFWRLPRTPGEFPYLTRSALLADELLMEGLESPGMAASEVLDEALERAVARGTLLRASLELSGVQEQLYFLNGPRGQAAIEAIQKGEWRPSSEPQTPIELRAERPNIFNLYEQNIGPLTPMIAESLREAEQSFPPEWVEQAIRIAVENNVRKWRYVQAILDDWMATGKAEYQGDTERARRRYRQGEFADFWDA